MLICPHCQSDNIVRNGLTAYGKQNYRCHTCKRQSVEREPVLTFEREALLKDLLLERVSLRAIARILKVSLNWPAPRWVVKCAQQRWQEVLEELPVWRDPVGKLEAAELQLYCLEADEMWTFVGAKDCPEWLWLAVERRTGLVGSDPR